MEWRYTEHFVFQILLLGSLQSPLTYHQIAFAIGESREPTKTSFNHQLSLSLFLMHHQNNCSTPHDPPLQKWGSKCQCHLLWVSFITFAEWTYIYVFSTVFYLLTHFLHVDIFYIFIETYMQLSMNVTFNTAISCAT